MSQMPEMPELNDPWLVAVWPGMGGVARMAGEYLGARLHMRHHGDFPSDEFFEINHVAVSEGVAEVGVRPRCPLLLRQEPHEAHDLLLLVGEAQPTVGGYRLCERLVTQAKAWGAKRVVAFAAMATQMHPSQRARVFGAVTEAGLLDELRKLGVEPLADGQIGGMNGLLLAAAQQHGLEGMCLLGEMPYFASQLPNPKAARAVLEVFTALMGFELDFTELDEQAEQVDQQLSQLVEQLQQRADEGDEDEEEDGGEFPLSSEAGEGSEPAHQKPSQEPTPERQLDPQTRHRIEQLFEQARQDRTTAFYLKRELDRLGVFHVYENRFLDLFKRGE